jgi:hypothetical protein
MTRLQKDAIGKMQKTTRRRALRRKRDGRPHVVINAHNALDHVMMQELFASQLPSLEQAGKALKSAIKKGSQLRLDHYPSLSPRRYYQHVLFRHCLALNHCVERLDQIRVFVRSFPRRASWERSHVTHYTWLEYHYGYHEITCVTIADLMVLLVNETYRLGMQPRTCTPSAVLSNAWIKGQPVEGALKRLLGRVRGLRESRNIHVHRGHATDLVALTKSQSLDLVQALGTSAVLGKPLTSRPVLKRLFRSSLPKLLERLECDRREIVASVVAVLDPLLHVEREEALRLED